VVSAEHNVGKGFLQFRVDLFSLQKKWHESFKTFPARRLNHRSAKFPYSNTVAIELCHKQLHQRMDLVHKYSESAPVDNMVEIQCILSSRSKRGAQMPPYTPSMLHTDSVYTISQVELQESIQEQKVESFI